MTGLTVSTHLQIIIRLTILSTLMEEIHERILNATIRVYAEAGFRGATTRRVAQEAGVNEITLFRHFGTKEALIKAALKASGRGIQSAPPEPRAPASELYVWALATYHHWYENRRLINQVMGDLAEHPELAPDICEEPSCEHAMLSRYLERMRELGMTSQPFHADAAAGLLLGSVFTHALWRDHFEKPGLPPVEEVIRQYVALLLAALGSRSPAEAARGKK
jgi:AcrR family transcriptional regulator